MFWLLRKIVFLAVLIGLGWFVMNYRIDGKTVKDYAVEFYESPLIQAAIQFGREKLGEKLAPYLSPDKTTSPEAQPDSLTDDDRKALDQLLQQKAEKP